MRIFFFTTEKKSGIYSHSNSKGSTIEKEMPYPAPSSQPGIRENPDVQN